MRMITFLIVLGVSVGVGWIVASTYIIRNLSKKIDLYEDTINEFYSRTSIVLHTIRALDEKRMFESDDEVGEVFNQIVDIIGVLKPLLYGEPDDNTETEED